MFLQDKAEQKAIRTKGYKALHEFGVKAAEAEVLKEKTNLIAAEKENEVLKVKYWGIQKQMEDRDAEKRAGLEAEFKKVSMVMY
jgi:hypothetical protein